MVHCRFIPLLSVLQSLGQFGHVVNVRPNGNVHVSVAGTRWTFNPDCLKPAPGENPSTHLDTSV